MDLQSYTQEGGTTIEQYEGTVVKIDAVANTDIKSCYLQLLRTDGNDMRQVNTVSMERTGPRQAYGQFQLTLNSARNGPRYTHYRLHIITDDGLRSQSIAANRIIVKPDVAPEIQVVEPLETELEVPANSRLRFLIRSGDVDFKLSGVSV
ncbi:MAG: hypothetical protein GY878_33410, partial [Fuerstiella sp.]|nr:hypothetical protein [Fuerstiella sp.]